MNDQEIKDALQQLQDQLEAAKDNRDRGVPNPKEFWDLDSELNIGTAPGAGTWDEIIVDLSHRILSLQEKRKNIRGS